VLLNGLNRSNPERGKRNRCQHGSLFNFHKAFGFQTKGGWMPPSRTLFKQLMLYRGN
jgi:hypothetical protein